MIDNEEVPDWMIEQSNKSAQLQYAIEKEAMVVDDLVYLVKQLVRSINNDRPDKVLSARAMDYLKRKELLGSPMREVSNDD